MIKHVRVFQLPHVFGFSSSRSFPWILSASSGSQTCFSISFLVFHRFNIFGHCTPSIKMTWFIHQLMWVLFLTPGVQRINVSAAFQVQVTKHLSPSCRQSETSSGYSRIWNAQIFFSGFHKTKIKCYRMFIEGSIIHCRTLEHISVCKWTRITSINSLFIHSTNTLDVYCFFKRICGLPDSSDFCSCLCYFNSCSTSSFQSSTHVIYSWLGLHSLSFASLYWFLLRCGFCHHHHFLVHGSDCTEGSYYDLLVFMFLRSKDLSGKLIDLKSKKIC